MSNSYEENDDSRADVETLRDTLKILTDLPKDK